MNKVKVFIASSEKTRFCAEMLRDALNDAEYCEARTWKEAIEAPGAPTKIELLELWTKEYDFAAIIFSGADVLAKDAADSMKTRDDCVFEAGLFMASIGRDRCFLVSGVKDKDKLPSDLAGINLVRFTEPDDFTNFGQCQSAMQTPAGVMKIRIQEASARPISNRPLSQDALLRRQQLGIAGELKEDQVVVASVQPLEPGYEAAKQVRQNLDNNIRYVYLFEGSPDTAGKIPQLLQFLLLAHFLDESDAGSFMKRKELVKVHRDEILEALRDICLNAKLNIFFMKESIDLEYCIHNATSDKVAKLYLKHGDDFIEWDSGPGAYRFWCTMREKNGAENPEPFGAVFHGSRNFELKDPFVSNLKINMLKYFGDLTDEVMKLCLEGAH